MALEICKICKRAFINGPQGESTCPECSAELKEIYPIVRNFLRDNEKSLYTAYDVSRILNIDLKGIEGLVTMGLIETAPAPVDDEEEDNKNPSGKPLKIRPLGERAVQDILTHALSSMHKYKKKFHEKEHEKKGDKKPT